MQNEMLKIDLSELNGSAFLVVEGEIDAHSVSLLESALGGLPKDKHVLIDMSAVPFMDSQGLRALIEFRLRIDGIGSVGICNPSRAVSRVLKSAVSSRLSPRVAVAGAYHPATPKVRISVVRPFDMRRGSPPRLEESHV